jgi:hypothetical protein
MYQIGLFIHMAAIISVAGGTMAAIYAESQLWKVLKGNPTGAKLFLPILHTSPTVIKIGVLAFIISGVLMLWSVQWVYLKQPWMIAKLVLFLSLPIRAATIHGAIVNKLTKTLEEPGFNLPDMMTLKTRSTRFHVTQYIIVAIIILLVIFKF